jgi:polyphosphate kinase
MTSPFPYINRELSWLEFNQRVLDEARDPAIPLLERLKFLAITAVNLDEFFMVRVGGLQLLVEQGTHRADPAGMSPEDQLRAVSERSHAMLRDQYACFSEEIEPQLTEAGIRRLRGSELNERQTRVIEQIFESEISSVLTPMAVTDRSDFPPLPNQTLNVLVRLKPAPDSEGASRFAVIPFGRSVSRFLTLSADRGYSYILFEDVVARLVNRFFAGEEILECVPFRITRNADLSIREDNASDLMAGMTAILNARKRSDCVRLEIAQGASAVSLGFLQDVLELSERDVFEAPGPVDLSSFMQLTELPGFDSLRYEPWPPQRAPEIEPGQSMFELLARRDVLLYHPYQSFEPVLRLIEEAANDPDVLAIKQILYRTSRNSPIVAALARAAQRGKYVTAIVELKARFDEARNIEWARNLEQAGVQVIYGVKGLKTHAKLCVIIRREPHGIQRYMHFGTGNYNEITARIYSDASLLTSNEELGADAVSFFNAITGYSQPPRYRKIEAAPISLRGKLLEMIDVETKRKEHGTHAEITAKLNSLVDPEIIEALYRASQAGVKIRLNVRGICCLKPGVKGVSDHIEVVSIVDRFLEHARILHFHHGGDERVFLSSADWMPRNLDRRIELLVPVEDAEYRRRLIDILNAYFDDNVKAHRLQPDGKYKRAKATSRKKPYRSQQVLYEEACRLVKQSERSEQMHFEPHRAPGAEE